MRIVSMRRRVASRLALVPMLALTFASAANADETELAPGITAEDLEGLTLEERTELLQAAGLGQSRGLPVPPAIDQLTDAPRPKAVKQGVIFVQFDEVELTMGGEDSKTNQSSISGGVFESFGDSTMARAAVMEAVKNDWEAYDILIVDERPEFGDYTMNVTSPTNPFGGGVLGIAPLDCFDMMTHNNITFAFHSANDGFGPVTAATTIGQEVAHSFGLEHVDDPTDIMNPVNAGGDPSFKDECLPVVAGGMCGAMHEEACGDMQQQNSHLELLAIFGTSAPDTVAPVVQITSPANGAEFGVGADFDIQVIATDDRKVGQLELYNGDDAILAKDAEPYTFAVEDIDEGVYTFKIVATDPAGNESESNIVQVVIGDPPLPADEGGGDDDEGGGDDDDDDGSGGSDDDPGANDEGGGGEGCGCGAAGTGAPALAMLLGLAAVSRRRRRA
jgi:uncharacterized protein (TIGR03382 family)